MTADLSAFIARLEAAEAGSRELDLVVVRAAGEDTRLLGLPPYTTSLDAALALAERVLPDWRVSVEGLNDSWFCKINPTADGVYVELTGFSRTPALALCIAILKAKMETEK